MCACTIFALRASAPRTNNHYLPYFLSLSLLFHVYLFIWTYKTIISRSGYYSVSAVITHWQKFFFFYIFIAVRFGVARCRNSQRRKKAAEKRGTQSCMCLLWRCSSKRFTDPMYANHIEPGFGHTCEDTHTHTHTHDGFVSVFSAHTHTTMARMDRVPRSSGEKFFFLLLHSFFFSFLFLFIQSLVLVRQETYFQQKTDVISKGQIHVSLRTANTGRQPTSATSQTVLWMHIVVWLHMRAIHAEMFRMKRTNLVWQLIAFDHCR